jgi:hypothetical protein
LAQVSKSGILVALSLMIAHLIRTGVRRMWPATPPRSSNKPIRRLALASALAVVLPVAIGVCAETGGAAAMAGPWEIALHDTPRKCGLVLRQEKSDAADLAIALPAGCRRAMPVLAEVGGWSAAGDSEVSLDDRVGKPVLAFHVGASNSLLATGPEGETYELTPTGRQRIAQAGGIQAAPRANAPAILAPSAAPPPPAAPVAKPQPAPVAASAARQPDVTTSAAPTHYTGKTSDLAGRYVILRAGAEGGKDIGCMLTLDDRARGPGGFKAQLAPACRDNGIVVFEPVGWHFERGKLVLTARKGHSAVFDYHAGGSWWKDPKDGGKPLGVRHM